jgi:hypothetical protein
MYLHIFLAKLELCIQVSLLIFALAAASSCAFGEALFITERRWNTRYQTHRHERYENQISMSTHNVYVTAKLQTCVTRKDVMSTDSTSRGKL